MVEVHCFLINVLGLEVILPGRVALHVAVVLCLQTVSILEERLTITENKLKEVVNT